MQPLRLRLKHLPEITHRALAPDDVARWGEIAATGFRYRLPVDMVEIYFDAPPIALFYSSLEPADARDNALSRQLAARVMQTGAPFRFPYYDRGLFPDVRYTDVLTLGRSVLVLPIMSDEATIGAVVLASRAPDVFREDAVTMLAPQADALAALYHTLFKPGNALAHAFDAGYYFDHAHDPVCVINSNCDVLYGNDAFEKFYQQHTDASDNEPKSFVALMGNDADSFRSYVSEALLHGAVTFDHTFLVGGEMLSYRVRLQRTADGNVCVWFYADAHAGDDDNISQSELPFAILHLNDKAEITSANERIAASLGYQSNELQRQSLFRFLHANDFAKAFDALRRVLDGDEMIQLSLRFSTKDQKAKPFHAWLQRDGESQATLYAFAQSETETASNTPTDFDVLPTGVTLLSDTFACTYLNTHAQTVIGYSRDEVQAAPLPDLLMDENNAQLFIESLAGLQPRQQHRHAYEVTAKDDTVKRILVSAARIADGYAVTLHDISDVQRDVEQWMNAAKAAQDTQHAEEQHLARMSHEIRTAMNGIIGLTNVLMQSGLRGEQQQILNHVKQSTDNLLVIINDILDLSKIRSGKLQVEKIPVNLRELFENNYAITLPKIGAKEIQYSYTVDPSVPEYVVTDPVRLNQILLNLISNAIKFTEKGKIEYSVRASNEHDRPVLLFEVSDTGIGMNEKNLTHVFEAYQQAEASTARHYGGTGLGLPIVKQLVELMGGTVSVSSAEGEGSVFAFALPLEASRFKPEAPEPVADVDVPEGVRVLVVDDNYINRLLVMHLLQSRGFEVVEAASGYEALDKLRDDDVDAVLMDLSMPDMDGFETTRLIRRSEQAYIRNVPVIAMTAHGFQEQVTNAREAGMNDYVMKPFKPEQLVRSLVKQLGIETSKPNEADEPKKINEPKAAEHSSEPSQRKKSYNLKFIEEYYNGDEALVKHILGLYVKETPHTLHEMEAALTQRDWAKFKALAHKIKTNVLMLGIAEHDNFFKTASSLKPDDGERTDAERLFRQFNAAVTHALAQLQRDKLS